MSDKYASSITWGAQSSDEAGYRKALHDMLTAGGNKVDFVGIMQNGQGMSDRDHEGHRGFVIDEIADASLTGIYAAANIVLLHAGTNDMKDVIDLPNAPRRLGNLIDLIFKHSEDAVVLVCQIIPSTTSVIQARVETFNNALPDLVDGYTAKGKKVALVAMNKALSTSDLADNLHPNDGGYKKMADAYYSGIEAADEKGWITEPGKYLQPPDSTSPDNCK
ncbi:SGNH hydrolase-type esterase domain-containing protein [Aspergillus cavernicola]|uniref:SGNH hydrolase-type esterase domain-containing protein n=1 Tax=Aspergillus cavernicola TaxID=176166 RepID=A0ABR4IVJ9_9EURO